MKRLKNSSLIIVCLAYFGLSAMEQPEVLSASIVSSTIFVASQLGNLESTLAQLEIAYHRANVRLLNRKPAKKEGKLLWKVELSNGGTEYDGDAAIWRSLLHALDQVSEKSSVPLREKALLLSLNASKSLAIESAQRLLFAEDIVLMTHGWQQYFKLKEPVTDEIKGMVSDHDRLEVLNETVEQQTKSALAWRKCFLEKLQDEAEVN